MLVVGDRLFTFAARGSVHCWQRTTKPLTQA